MGIFTRNKWTVAAIAVVLLWFVGAGVGGPYFGKISQVAQLDLASFLPKSSESAEVNTLTEKFRDEKLLPAIVVFESANGNVSDDDERAVESVSKKIENLEGVKGSVSPPIKSDDGEALLVSVPLDDKVKVAKSIDEIRGILDANQNDGMKSYIGGPGAFSAELSKAFSHIDGILLAVALGVVFVILLVVYRSPLLPVLVLLTSTFALAVSILIVYWLAKADFVTLNGQVQGILFILVIGAATDYSLLFVSRFREELYHTGIRTQAIWKAWKATVEPVLASGSTVIVGLMCLLLSDLASNKALGPVGSIGIAMAMLSALTLLPALLTLVGRKAFWPVIPRANKAALKDHEAKLRKGVWHKVGDLVAARPRLVWTLTTLVLLIGTLGLSQLKADGVAQSDMIVGQSEAREAQEVLARHFAEGSGSPVLIVTDKEKYSKVADTLDSLSEVTSVSVVANDSPSGTIPLGEDREELDRKIREGVVSRLPAGAPAEMVDAVVLQANPFANAQVKVADAKVLLQAVLSSEPDSQEAKNTIPLIRERAKSVDASALIGGTTAVQYDTNEASKHDRSVILPAILVAITIILMLLLRSVVAPLLLLATTVLSFGFALGVSALVFNHIFKLPGADPAVVLYGFVFLVALGIDYNIFLMTRVREESLKHGTAKGVIKGLVTTGGVITSAGIVLAATFAALVVIPIGFLLQLAFLVAFGVIIDTIVVRSLLVPALVRDIGRKVWWPARMKD